MITQHSVVTLHYTVADADTQETLDSSEGQEPLSYLHGTQSMIPGFEAALEGKDAGDRLEFTLEPSEGYGEIDPENIREVPKDAFAGIENPEVGMPIAAQMEQGTLEFVITKISDDTITLDGNHPLAGKRLAFTVEILELRGATPEEIDHGHVH